jgi:hypothetical protein
MKETITMKRFLMSLTTIIAACFTTLLAQSFETVRVHFDQTVDVVNNSLPAGDYTISLISFTSEEPLVRFRSDSGQSIIVLASRDNRATGDEATKTDVILDNTGSVPQVTRIQIEGSSVDLVLPAPESKLR